MKKEQCRLQIYEKTGGRYLNGNQWIENQDWITLAIGTEAALREELAKESWAFDGCKCRIISEEDYLKGE
jgi:hypothetical protein